MTLAVTVPDHCLHRRQDPRPSRCLCFFVSIALVAAGAVFGAAGLSKKEKLFAVAWDGGPGKGMVGLRDSLGHEVLEQHAPGVDVGGEVGVQRGDKADRLAKEDKGHVGPKAKEGVVRLCLVNGELRQR